MTPPALVAVLAGGRSRRMGGPKAGLELGGRALVEWPLAAAREAGLEAVVVAKAATALPLLEVPVWTEPDEPSHPLTGLVCALERAGGARSSRRRATCRSSAPGCCAGSPRPAARRRRGPTTRSRAATRRPRCPCCGPRWRARRPSGRRSPRSRPAELGAPEGALLGVNTPEELAAAAARVLDRMPPSAEQWIEAFAAALGRPAPSAEERDAVLKLASVAAHASERRAAPIACWLAAASGLSLDEALVLAQELAGGAAGPTPRP